MTVSYMTIRRIGLACLALPSLIFLLGFLRWYIAVPLSIALLLAYWFAARSRGEAREGITLSPRCFAAVLAVAALWCWLAGIGGLYYQSADYAARNAVFRDLITLEWPVLYPHKNSALVYYIGFWLPAALVGKCFLPLGADAAFLAGNLALLLYAVLCVSTVFLLLLSFLRVREGKRVALVLCVFILFSGLDILGTLCNAAFMGHSIPDHIEWWAFYFQFSSNTTALFWVFNQAIPCFLATLLFLSEERAHSDAFLLIALLAFSPFACVGLAVLMLVRFAARFLPAVGQGEGRALWRELLSVQNLVPLFTLLPVFFLYYKTNLAFAMTKLPQLGWRHLALALAGVLCLVLLPLGYRYLARRIKGLRPAHCALALLALLLCIAPLLFTRAEAIYYSFLLLECGIYLALLYKEHCTDSLYFATDFLLALCPLFVIGTSADFSMRVSLPALCVLCVLCLRSLLAGISAWRESAPVWRRVMLWGLCAALLLGAVTPMFELVRGVVAVCREGTLLAVNDSYGTMAQIFPNGIGSTDKNFIAWDYTKTFFFRYLAKGVG